MTNLTIRTAPSSIVPSNTNNISPVPTNTSTTVVITNTPNVSTASTDAVVKTGKLIARLSTKTIANISLACIVGLAIIIGAVSVGSTANSSTESTTSLAQSPPMTVVAVQLSWNAAVTLDTTATTAVRCAVANVSQGTSTILSSWTETVNDAIITITEDHPLNSGNCPTSRRLVGDSTTTFTTLRSLAWNRQLPNYVYPINPKAIKIDTIVPVSKTTTIIQKVQTQAQTNPSGPLGTLQKVESTGALVTPSPSPTPSFTPTPTPSSTSSTVTVDSIILSNALRTGMSNSITGKGLQEAFFNEINRMKDLSSSILTFVYGNLNGVTWDPTHDSIQMKIADSSNVFPLLLSNKDYKSADNNIATLGVAGYNPYGNARFIALGGIPFGSTGFTGSSLEKFMKRCVAWLMRGTNPESISVPWNLQRITIAHIPGDASYWFKYDKPTTNWFNTTYVGANVSQMNSCEYLNLASCLTNPMFNPTRHLLVLGPQVAKGHDNVNWANDITDGSPVVNAVKAFLEAGGSLLYLHYDGTDTVINTPLFEYLGLGSSTDNYWKQAGLLNADKNTVTSQTGNNDLGSTVTTTLNTLMGITPLTADDVAGCTGTVNTWTSCTNAGFKNKVANGALAVRDTLRGIDGAGIDIFNKTGLTLLKILVLLGDKYRRNTTNIQEPNIIGLSYTMKSTDYQRIAAAAFADSTVLYRRSYTPPQDDLGSLYCPRTMVRQGTCIKNKYDYHTWQNSVTIYKNEQINIDVPSGDTWTTSGLFALPGRTIQVQRILDNTVPTNLKVYLRFFFQREAVTKAFEVSDSLSKYDRPQFSQSHYILIPNDNSVINVTSPYGGPIYIGFTSVTNAKAAYTGNGNFPAIQLRFSGITKHSAILDISNDDQITSFVNTLLTNPIPFVDIKADGFEVHARKDHITNSLIVFDYEGHISNYSGLNGAKLMMNDYRDAFVNRVYTLAGFKIPGKSLTDSLPTTVKSICSNFAWPCTDETIHRPSSIQHSNYDEDAACGWGCSGNPWDAGWSIVPTGWGESHELGHNLQKSKLNIHYVPSSYGPNTAKDKNLWSSYSNRAGENSNNIFPYHTIWAYRRIDFQDDTKLVDDHMNHLDAYAAIQSAKARIIKNNELLVLKQDCTIWKKFPSTTPSNIAAMETIYWDNSYAADNSPRMSFYLQLPLLLAGKTMNDGTVLTNGFDIFPLIYSSIRYFENNVGTDTAWLGIRDKLGFSLFNRTGHSTYGTGTINNIPGNDYLVIILTKITGYDFRPYFDIRGIPYTDLANNQVAQLITDNIATKGLISTNFYTLETDFPIRNFANSITTVPLDGTSSWTKSGSTYNNWNPKNCVV